MQAHGCLGVTENAFYHFPSYTAVRSITRPVLLLCLFGGSNVAMVPQDYFHSNIYFLAFSPKFGPKSKTSYLALERFLFGDQFLRPCARLHRAHRAQAGSLNFYDVAH